MPAGRVGPGSAHRCRHERQRTTRLGPRAGHRRPTRPDGAPQRRARRPLRSRQDHPRSEALLVAAGTVTRRRPRRGRHDGHRPRRRRAPQQRRSRSLGAPAHGGIKLNLLDTPGYPDFVGELRAGLRAADAALFVVSAVDGVDGATRLLWEECAAVGMPRAVVVTKLDQAAGRLRRVPWRSASGSSATGCMPLYLPVHGDDEAVAGLIGLLPQQIYDYTGGTAGAATPDPSTWRCMEAPPRRLIEAIIQESEDDSLIDRYLGGEEVDLDVLIADLLSRRSPRRASTPSCRSRTEHRGGHSASCSTCSRPAFPSPTAHPLPTAITPAGRALRRRCACDPDGPLVAEVVARPHDPYVGRVSLVRVFSRHAAPRLRGARLRPPRRLRRRTTTSGHGDHDEDERVGALSCPARRRAAPRAASASPATSALVAKLSRAETGDTLSAARTTPPLSSRGCCPTRCCPSRSWPRTKSDEDKLAGALQRLVAEDPTLRLEHNAETHQVVLWTMGQAHVDVLLDRLRERYGVQVEPEPLRVPLRETFSAPGHRPRPPRQAERRPRPVRRVRHHRGAAAARRGLRVRRQGRRRLGAAAVHPQRGEGRAGPAGARRASPASPWSTSR